ncbi:hypothetical protein I5J36_gp53 [Mycobacterium phage Mendokysei]|uniref:Uncharacterized protein n=1 Tax=Mycobacterium phage Mendokysei TaxID=2099637 RepID=A0A2P1CGE4_9CAUD|nr:hypothetical protein I5J36_gp53 [Mycobacterium phage Mendokysei]AVJ50269.1 hypothetical protein SEA_MENDOKYSEI_53 [Mycobacterium phage Mendokysei]
MTTGLDYLGVGVEYGCEALEDDYADEHEDSPHECVLARDHDEMHRCDCGFEW